MPSRRQSSGNRVFAAQTFQHDADLLLRAVAFARLATDLADMFFGR